MHVAMTLMTGNAQMAGGVPAAVMSRARWLHAQGVAVTVVCRGAPGFERPEERDGITLFPVRPRNYRLGKLFVRMGFHPLLPPAMNRALERRHRELPVDLVDVHDSQTALGAVPMARRHGLPVALTVHGSAYAYPELPSYYRRASERWETFALRAASVVLPVSEYIRDYHLALGLLPADRFRVVPNAVPADVLQVGQSRRLDLKQGETLRLFFGGRLEAEKRLHLLLRALARVKDTGPFHLTVLGDGTERQACLALASELGLDGLVSFSEGFVRDRARILEALGRSHVFVFPTVREAFSVALIEAMGARLCPLVSDIPPNLEALGGVGLSFPRDDEDALAECLRELRRDLSRVAREADRAHERAQAFLPERCYPATLRAYEDAISGARGRGGR